MDSNSTRNEQVVDAEPHQVAPDQIAPDGTQRVEPSAKESRDFASSADPRESRLTRNETVAVKDRNDETQLEPMDRIDTAEKRERSDSDEQTLHLRDTVKEATKTVKRKLYLHHRNRKDLDKQFTAGSAPTRMGDHQYHEKTDPEALEPVDTRAPTFWRNLLIMVTTFPYWNMAFWSGWCYSIGSALFVIDGAWAWVPIQWPNTEFVGEEEYGVPLLFFFGAILYQIGAVMAYLEAVNDGSFAGAAMKRLLEGHQDIEKELLDAKLHTFFGHLVPHHHHDDKEEQEIHRHQSSNPNPNPNPDADANWEHVVKHGSPEDIHKETSKRVERRGGVDQGPAAQEGQVRQYVRWRWWPTWHGFFTYHIYELGYVACTIQLFGVTLYGVTAIVILPGIFDSLAWWQELGAYWVPQVVASCCFLIASIMFTIMAQEKWHTPKWDAVSWWIGIHAIIGSVGFLLDAIFGIVGNDQSWANYQSPLSSMWGSFFYMLSGLFQWYEAINVNVGPVLAFPNNRVPVLLRKGGS